MDLEAQPAYTAGTCATDQQATCPAYVQQDCPHLQVLDGRDAFALKVEHIVEFRATDIPAGAAESVKAGAERLMLGGGQHQAHSLCCLHNSLIDAGVKRNSATLILDAHNLC